MAQLIQMPPELLARISVHLNTVELGCLRRTCKHVERLLFDKFAKEFFSKRQFMLEEHSLQALVDISAHPTLAVYLNCVIISAEKLGHKDSREYAQLAGQVAPQVLLFSGRASALIAQAFKNLPNLRTVGLRNYAGQGRTRDGEHCRWRSYGWSLGRSQQDIEQIKTNATGHIGDGLAADSTAATTFPMLLHAMASSGVKPGMIEVILHRHQGLEASSFNVLEGHLGSEIRELVSQLHSLHLGISLFGRDSEVPISSHDHEGPSRQELLALLPLQKVLHTAKALKSLRLNMSNRGMWSEELIDWIGGAKGLSPYVGNNTLAPPPPAEFLNLETLELGFCQVAPHRLVRALTRFPHLRHFSLYKVSLFGLKDPYGSEMRGKGKDQIREECGAVWAGFLRQLAQKLSAAPQKIQTAMIKNCALAADQDEPAMDRVDVLWRTSDAPVAEESLLSRLEEIQYRASFGSEITDWLLTMAERAYVPFPDLDDWAGHNGESPDEDDFDDQDEDEEDEEEEDDG